MRPLRNDTDRRPPAGRTVALVGVGDVLQSGRGAVIFKREWVPDFLATGEALDCRPLYRRNGQAMRYEVGQVHAIQPGRFQPHVAHARIVSMEPATAGELRAREDQAWEIPDDWGDGLEVYVMRLKLEGRRACCA